jgi:RND family efflux transporter MFP subunit
MKQLLYTFSLSIMLIACNQTVQQTEDAHAHEAKLQLTEYSSNMELFAEADPFAVGQNSGILAHFSWLENFKPLESGDVTVSLIVGTKGVKQTLSKPVRPGIYKFEIQPQVAGTGKIIFDINSEKGKTQIIVNNITVYNNKHDAEHAAEGIVVSETNATVFTKEQSWKIDFATGHPNIELFGQVIKTTAQVESTQGDEILISAKTNGIVILSADHVLEGKSVSNGQVLYSISGSGLADNNSAVRFQEAKNNYDKTKADYERLTELAKDKIISEKDLLNAKNQYDNAKVVYDNLNKNFNESGQKVTSSMNGYVKQVFVQNGQYVEAGQPIVSISQNKTLLLKAEVQQKFAPLLGTISSANIRTLQNNQTFTLEQLNGKVLSYGRNANKDNYLIPVNLQIDNNGAFVSGGFVELYLKTQSSSQALTIPATALLEEQGIYFVFVQVHPELFEKREVKVGVSDGLKTEITKGIKAEERVVTTGAILVKLAQATGTLDAHSGHNH